MGVTYIQVLDNTLIRGNLLSKKDIRKDITKYILQGNDLIKSHAEQRHSLLKKIIAIINNGDNSHLIDLALEEVSDLHQIVNSLESDLKDLPSGYYYKYKKLTFLHLIMKQLERKEKTREEIIDEIIQLDANLASRDELIDILEEYLSMENATINRLVDEYATLQEMIEHYKEMYQTYTKLSKYDPRYKAVEILKQNPQGMSLTQLSFMLGTTHYNAQKIIRELINIGLIERKENSQLLQIPQNIEVGKSLEPIPEILSK